MPLASAVIVVSCCSPQQEYITQSSYFYRNFRLVRVPDRWVVRKNPVCSQLRAITRLYLFDVRFDSAIAFKALSFRMKAPRFLLHIPG